MTDLSERYSAIVDGFTTRARALSPDHWPARTPCSEWTVRDLLVHVITVQRRMVAGLDGTEAAEVNPNGDLVALWRSESGKVVDALGDESKLSKNVQGPAGEMPFGQIADLLLCTDTLVHTWDLSRATGQDERIDGDAAARALANLEPFDESMRGPNAFGPKVTPAPGADTQTRLLNFLGREV